MVIFSQYIFSIECGVPDEIQVEILFGEVNGFALDHFLIQISIFSAPNP